MTTEFRPPNLALSTIGLSLATFMQVLDTTIANVSLPTIAGNLGVSSNQSTWVITSFAVSMAIALPLTGFLTRRFGEVRLFTACTLLFALTSFLCGISQSMGMLILFRALQGAVAGPMYPITQSLLIGIYPPAKRGMALALLAMVTVAVDVPTAVGLKPTVNMVEAPAATLAPGCAVSDSTPDGLTVTAPTVSAAFPVLPMVNAVDAVLPTTAPAMVTVEPALTGTVPCLTESRGAGG